MRKDVEVDIYVGKDLQGYINDMASLRINAFKEFPYLYAGQIEYEHDYLKGYANDPQAMFTIAKLDGKVVGIASGIPLNSETKIIAEAKQLFFEKQTQAIDDYYYYGEFIVLPEFRGMGITRKLLHAQDNKIKAWGFKHSCILTVMREDDHPLKPLSYQSTDVMWEKLDYVRCDLTITYQWPTIQADGSVKEADNALQFWIKSL